ncbi:GSU2403 family nucleotidyltransferase fold protein [Comamonas sp.]|uniref:GSU2403 family nucleotidyltransferase fold protein n=1 Tax=Comamonas sp. TaxID=34028 RepID=UPI00289A95F7|nr:GSU2403 family nucleotidyltransferase fold protein [Comamonas sp.]
MNDLEAFAKLVQALEPWRQQLVIIGGWSHRLHRLDPRANLPDYQPVSTRDTDLAFANKAPIEGDIKQALAQQGFKENLSGDHRPPAAHYTLGNESNGFYAEFLTPLQGSGKKRNGETDATMEKAGISAQKIRHLDILLIDPWSISLHQGNGFPLPRRMDVLVAHPLCFMVQKLLIQKNRSAGKRAQDVLYIYDTIELFAALLEEFNAHWTSRIAPALGNQAEEVQTLSLQSFAEVNDMVRNAAQIPVDRKLSPEQIQATCSYAFDRILRA